MTGETPQSDAADTVRLGRIGEVVSARTSDFVAEADQLHAPPSLGAVTTIRDSGTDILAFVTAAETTPKEASRRTSARGGEFESEEEFYRRRPEINRLIRTTFSAVIVAHRTEGRLYPYLPPRPPHLHAFVYPADVEDITALAGDPLTLRNIASARGESINDFLPAAIRTMSAVAGSDRAQEDYLRETGRRLVHIMRDDIQGLQVVLAKIRPGIGGAASM